MTYLLDANAFIEPKNRYYPFAICPGFWDWLDLFHRDGWAFSITAVRDELSKREDDLSAWVGQRQSLFLTPDAGTVPHLAELAQWAHDHPQFTPHAKAEFLRKADFQLIAVAAQRGFTVVTFEASAKDAKKRIMIPDACRAVGVASATLHEMVASAGPRFILDVA